MVRTKEYDRREVIDAATRVFWAKGYKNTSISDLVSATGLNKRSMYMEFGNKAGLFHECIDHYAAMLNKDVLSILNRQPPGLDNIRDFFLNRLDYACSKNSHGCMIVNTAGEKEHIDEQALCRVNIYMGGLKEAFLACLAAARKEGKIKPGQDCDVLANLLLHLTAGLMILCKTDADRDSLEAMVELVMEVLRS